MRRPVSGAVFLSGGNMKIGFLGLGIMGRPMALNLIKGGHELTVWARRPMARLVTALSPVERGI